MRHPFDGINEWEGQASGAPQPATPAPELRTRRSFLASLIAAAMGLFGLFGLLSRARAQNMQKNALSLALGEAGSSVLTRAFKEEAGDPTKDPTQMRGEDGGVTTLAANEEAASTRRVGEEGGATTKALREEGATTNAIGEEGGKLTKALNEDGGRATTLAIGEEGGKRPPIRVTTDAINEEGGDSTTLALGEEGGQN